MLSPTLVFQLSYWTFAFVIHDRDFVFHVNEVRNSQRKNNARRSRPMQRRVLRVRRTERWAASGPPACPGQRPRWCSLLGTLASGWSHGWHGRLRGLGGERTPEDKMQKKKAMYCRWEDGRFSWLLSVNFVISLKHFSCFTALQLTLSDELNSIQSNVVVRNILYAFRSP